MSCMSDRLMVRELSFFRRRTLSAHCLISTRVLSRKYAVGMNGDRSRLGCCSVRPRAEHRCERTRQTVNGFTCVEWPARARPTAPEAGALLNPIALYRLSSYWLVPSGGTRRKLYG